MALDYAAFDAYVFEVVKPTFVHMHGYWTRITRLTADPRFAEQYAPIFAYRDKYDFEKHAVDLYSGDYVRRDALDAGAMARLRAVRDTYEPCWDKQVCAPADVVPDAVLDGSLAATTRQAPR